MNAMLRGWVGLLFLAGGCGASPPLAPDAAPIDPNAPPPAGPTVEAGFVGVGHRAGGRVRLTLGQGRGRLEFQSDFVVDAVPTPYIYLNTTQNPNSGKPLRIALLRANGGGQQYDFEVPAGVEYAWILIWCDRFNVPVAEAAIPQ